MLELIAHIEAENAKTQAWIDEDPSNRMAGMLTTNPSHWEEMGITTVAQYERYLDESAYREIYKSWTGCRPGSVAHLSDEELRKEIEVVSRLASEQMERERRQEAENLDNVKKAIANIQETVVGSTEADALRIWIDSLDLDNIDKMYGWEKIEWMLDLPYRSLEKLYGKFTNYCEVSYEY